MYIEEIDNRFVVYKNVGYRRSYFCFYVDGCKGSWSFLQFQAAHFKSREEAEATIERLRSFNRAKKAR